MTRWDMHTSVLRRISAVLLSGLLVGLSTALPAAQAILPPSVDPGEYPRTASRRRMSRCGKATSARGPSPSLIRT